MVAMLPRPRALVLLTITLALGCESQDERLVQVAMQSNAEQAQQNREFANLHRETIDNHRRMLESWEKTRQEVVSLEQDLQSQRQRLDEERVSLANERYRESLLSPVLSHFGLLGVASLPLILSWYLIHGLHSAQVDETEINAVLISDLVSEQPVFLPAPARAPGLEQRDIPAPDDDAPLPF